MTTDDEPQPPVAKEAMGRADEQQPPCRQHGRERPSEEAHAVLEVLGDAERRHLPLVVPQHALDHRRDGAEEVPDPGHGLRHEHQPSFLEKALSLSATVSIGLCQELKEELALVEKIGESGSALTLELWKHWRELQK